MELPYAWPNRRRKVAADRTSLLVLLGSLEARKSHFKRWGGGAFAVLGGFAGKRIDMEKLVLHGR